MLRNFPILLVVTSASLLLSTLSVAQPPGGGGGPEFVREGMRLLREGKQSEALALYQKELTAAPDSTAANNAMGTLLDLTGRSSEAKRYFAKAIATAPNAQAKANAQRAMAMSYAFENDCNNTAKYEQMVMEYWATKPDFYQQGEMVNEAARVCIEAGNLDAAERWYRKGTELGLQEPDIKPDRTALWNFRLEHALARLAARRGEKAEAMKHVTAAKAVLDGNAEMAKAQAVFFPYLTGYVALYTNDPKSAVEDLQKANQNDPFIQCLLGQAYERTGQKEKAMELYRKASQTTAHNPPAAYAIPFAAKKLKAAGK